MALIPCLRRRGHHATPRFRSVLATVLSLCCAFSAAAAAQQTVAFTDQRTGVSGWRFESGGIRIQLIQRLPDQTRAFFLGRGFPPAGADRLAERCLFQTIVHNTEPVDGPKVAVDLHQWRVLKDGGREPLLLKSHWQQVWQQMGVDDRARIAFQWAFFPTEQQFAPGDWNMGMTSYPVAPGQPLRLEVVWHEQGQRRQGLIEGPVCGSNDMAAELLK